MSISGYGPLASPSVLSFGTKVIEDSLKITLCNQDGVLEPVEAGRRMEMNYQCLNYRKGMVEVLERRPSGMGKCQVLVLHGAEDEAVRISSPCFRFPTDRNFYFHLDIFFSNSILSRTKTIRHHRKLSEKQTVNYK